MGPLRRFFRRVTNALRPARAEHELARELASHLALIEEDFERRGLSPAAATTAAKRAFASVDQTKEQHRAARSFAWIDECRRDLWFACRGLAREKSFAALSLVTLALAIGATTAVFSVMNTVVLRPLPFEEPERLVQMYGTPAIRGEAVDRLDDLRRQSASFEALVGYAVSGRYLRTPLGPERVIAVEAERDFFSMLGTSPLIGRTFRQDDPASVAVVSETFWRQRLNASPLANVPLMLDGAPLTLIGVMPDAFQFPYGAGSVLKGVADQLRTDVWVPLDPPRDAMLRARGRFAHVTGRLKPSVGIASAQDELTVIAARFAAANPDPYGARGVRIEPLSEVVVSRPIRQALVLLFGAVAILLVLACANVAGLSLARTITRRREVFVRMALGAGTARLVRQFLVESLLLSTIGGLAGLVIAWWSVDWLMAAAVQLPRAHEVAIDWRVFGFLAVVCAIAASVPGLASAFAAVQTGRGALSQWADSHATTGRGAKRLRDALVVVEVALALMLAVGATLLVRELVRLRTVDRGMNTANVVTLHLGQRPPAFGVVRRGAPPESETRRFYEIAERVGRLHGVSAAGFVQVLPLQNWGWTANSVDLQGRGSAASPAAPFTFELRYVTPGYFPALAIPIRRGRGFTVDDTRAAPAVILINETFARQYFGDRDPIGQPTSRGTIVGVVGDVRNLNLDQPSLPELYYPIAQNWSQVSDLGMSLVVRSAGSPASLINELRQVIRTVDPEDAVFSVKTMEAVVDDSLAGFNLFLWLMTAFAALAVVLALTGTYGLVSYIASARIRECAIRAALGAGQATLVRLVLAQGARVTALGLTLGAAGAAVAAPLLRGLPVTVRGPDLVTLVPLAVVIGAIAVIASLRPARRAASADPMSLLRTE